MCRIFGNASVKYSLPSLSEFSRLTLLSQAGGPDHTGYYESEHVQFGFNRLSIIDPSDSGNQPIISPSGRFVLMLNGEVYNFKDLIIQFDLKSLRSGSDAEVVSHLLDILSFEDLVVQLNGMFAISIFDKLEKRLILARDFAGIKPLFYGTTTKGFVFASQFNQILFHPWFQKWTWSITGVREYLQFGFMSAPYTVAEGVFQLKPGTWLEYNVLDNNFQVHSYQIFFNGAFSLKSETSSSTIEGCHEAIRNAVSRQLVSDVPLGVFLSGGIDSCLVSAVAAKVRPDICSLTIGFNQIEYDESEKAAQYAKILGIKNQCIRFTDSDLLNLFHDHCSAQTEPLADYSTLPTYFISKVASSQFKVMLSGDGGDELFWGYPRFRSFAHSAPFFRLPGKKLRKVVMKGLKLTNKDITGFLGESNLGDANLAFHSFLDVNMLQIVLPDSTLSSDAINDYWCESNTQSESLLYLRKNEFYQHLQRVLAKVDRMSMSSGLEVRVPLLDKEVIQTASDISPNMEEHNQLKYVLKTILTTYVPSRLIEVQKRGFNPPLKLWVRSILREQMNDTIADIHSLNIPFLNSGKLLDYSNAFMNEIHDNIDGFWTIYSLINWHNNLSR